jgi:Mg/Co/Ni transporter MgtE
VARMAADDAADLIVEIDQERRGRILALLPPAQRRQIEALLGYNPSTAGGLMSPDFISLDPADTVAQALAKVRASKLGAGTLTTVFLLDGEGGLQGSVFVVTMLRADGQQTLEEIAEREPVSVPTDADLPEVARMMTDYNLVMLPVLDGDERMVGVVTVDDVLELTLPSGWRRRFGLVRD